MEKIVVGVSGASGIYITERIMGYLRDSGRYRLYLIYTNAAETVARHEIGGIEKLIEIADKAYSADDFESPLASGGFGNAKMVVVPASMKTISNISTGNANNLLIRAVDVFLKENNPIVIVPRETPLNKIHLRNLATLADLNIKIIMPVLTFYTKPRNINDMVDFIIMKIFKILKIDINLNINEWNNMER